MTSFTFMTQLWVLRRTAVFLHMGFVWRSSQFTISSSSLWSSSLLFGIFFLHFPQFLILTLKFLYLPGVECLAFWVLIFSLSHTLFFQRLLLLGGNSQSFPITFGIGTSFEMGPQLFKHWLEIRWYKFTLFQ